MIAPAALDRRSSLDYVFSNSDVLTAGSPSSSRLKSSFSTAIVRYVCFFLIGNDLLHDAVALLSSRSPLCYSRLRYHGVLAANAKVRAEAVPKKPIKKGVQLPLFAQGDAGYLEPPPEPSRHPWPWLLKPVFAVDISVCPKCTGRMRVIEVAKDEHAAARVLSELGIARAPPPKPAPRHIDPRQLSLSFAG